MSSMKELAEVFSIKHRTASGNAIVDLALLNVHGIIDRDRCSTNDLEALSQLCTQTRVFNCNFMEIAVELTWLGFADSLLKVAITMTRTELKSFIPTWHAELIQELAVLSDAFSPLPSPIRAVHTCFLPPSPMLTCSSGTPTPPSLYPMTYSGLTRSCLCPPLHHYVSATLSGAGSRRS